jgi:DNA-binding transcriptional MerR regulator
LTTVSLPDGADTLVTATEAATVCSVRLCTISAWRARGKITPAGIDERGRYVYRLRDVAAVELSTRSRAGRQ